MPVQGTFSDFKVVKTRKVAQFIVEVPMELADKALHQLGGLPQFSAEQWVALVAINPDVQPEPEKPKKSLAQIAGILCQDQRFWEFMSVDGIEGAAEQLRLVCGVNSRADIVEGTDAADRFNEMRTSFDVFTGKIAGPR